MMKKTKDEIKLKELCEERNSLSKKLYNNKVSQQRMKELKNEIKNCQRRLMIAPERMVLIEKVKSKSK